MSSVRMPALLSDFGTGRGPLAALAPSGSIFSPASPEAHAISSLFIVSLWICAVIFAVVAGIIGYSLLKFRWREGDPDPAQIAGNRTVEFIWMIVPFLIVLSLFGLTVRAMSRAAPPLTGPPDLVVVGHQWWWEIRYPREHVVTANEIHIPVGQPISVLLDTADVLREFWVPELTRKMTTVPGAGNHVWIEADRPGAYNGVCSEFCGTQHAWMRFQVIAEPPAEYRAWIRTQRQPAREVLGAAEAGRGLFERMTCVDCHAIHGTTANADAGPDLTHFASRRLIGAGVAVNTPENLRRWLIDPQTVKPGAKMPDFKLTRRQVDELVAYFETLK